MRSRKIFVLLVLLLILVNVSITQAQTSDEWFSKGKNLYNIATQEKESKNNEKANEYYKKAKQCFEESLKINSNNSDAWTDRGICIYNLFKNTSNRDEYVKEEIICYIKALDINSSHNRARVNLKQALESEFKLNVCTNDENDPTKIETIQELDIGKTPIQIKTTYYPGKKSQSGIILVNIHDNENISVEAAKEVIRKNGGTLVELIYSDNKNWYLINEDNLKKIKPYINTEKYNSIKSLNDIFQITELTLDKLSFNGIPTKNLETLMDKEFTEQILINKLQEKEYSEEQIKVILKYAKYLGEKKLAGKLENFGCSLKEMAYVFHYTFFNNEDNLYKAHRGEWNYMRYLLFQLEEKPDTYSVDTNRIFTREGLEFDSPFEHTDSSSREKLKKFTSMFTEKYLEKNKLTFQDTLVVICLHNNRGLKMKNCFVDKDNNYDPKQVEDDTKSKGNKKCIYEVNKKGECNFFLVTDINLYYKLGRYDQSKQKLTGNFNIICQNNNTVIPDGSLSVYFGKKTHIPYINIETFNYFIASNTKAYSGEDIDFNAYIDDNSFNNQVEMLNEAINIF